MPRLNAFFSAIVLHAALFYLHNLGNNVERVWMFSFKFILHFCWVGVCSSQVKHRKWSGVGPDSADPYKVAPFRLPQPLPLSLLLWWIQNAEQRWAKRAWLGKAREKERASKNNFVCEMAKRILIGTVSYCKCIYASMECQTLLEF